MNHACEMAIEVLRATRDGDDLDPRHLSLIEAAVNCGLDGLPEERRSEFKRVYSQVIGPEGYRPPWFHGIENMTIGNDGSIYWKGRRVEHYNMPWAWSDEAKEQAEELAKRCLHLESIDVKPSVYTAIWDWEKFSNKKTPTKQVGVDCRKTC